MIGYMHTLYTNLLMTYGRSDVYLKGMVGGGVLPVYDEWNAVDASFPAGLYLLTVDDGLKSKTVKMIVR